jgi:hypothetical protein
MSAVGQAQGQRSMVSMIYEGLDKASIGSKELSALQDIHASLAELESSKANERQCRDKKNRGKNLPLQTSSRLDSYGRGEERIEAIENWSQTQRDEHLPCGNDIARLNFNVGRCKSL